MSLTLKMRFFIDVIEFKRKHFKHSLLRILDERFVTSIRRVSLTEIQFFTPRRRATQPEIKNVITPRRRGCEA